MNNELFNRARALYQARDYQGALSAFSQCLQDGARLAQPLVAASAPLVF